MGGGGGGIITGGENSPVPGLSFTALGLNLKVTGIHDEGFLFYSPCNNNKADQSKLCNNNISDQSKQNTLTGKVPHLEKKQNIDISQFDLGVGGGGLLLFV